MRVCIIHGNNVVASLDKARTLIDKFDPMAVSRYGKEISAEELELSLASSSLFTDQRLVVLDNPDFDPKDLPTETKDVFLMAIFTKDLPVSSVWLKWAKSIDAQILNFSETPDKSVFNWLDYLASKDAKSYSELERLLESQAEQYLVTMYFYNLRRLAIPPNKDSKWQQKLAVWQKNFPRRKVQELYRLGLEYDYKVKTGKIDSKSALFWMVEAMVEN